MFPFLSRYLAKTKIERLNNQRKKSFINWEKIEKLALIIDNSSSFSKNDIDKFSEEQGKYCDVYYLELNSKAPTYSDWICLTKKDKTLLNLPKTHIDSTLKNRQYQLVINACEKHSLYAAVLTAQLNTPYNCGLQNLMGETDLIIEKENGKTLLPYLKDVVKYLQMIKTN